MSGQWEWAKGGGALRAIVDSFFEPHSFSPGWKDDPLLCRICERGEKAAWHQ